MQQERAPKLKTFKVTNLCDVTFTDAPSRQSIIEDLQRMGCLDKDTIVEEYTEGSSTVEQSNSAPRPTMPAGNIPKIFTMPGGQKIKDDNGTLYGLEWTPITAAELAKRAGCENLKILGPDGILTSDVDMSVLDWVKLKPEEGESEDASKTDINV